MIRELYAAFARGDMPAVRAALDPQIVWNEAENFPYADGNPYIGPQGVVEGVFSWLIIDWDGWSLDIGQYFDAGQHIAFTGRYVAFLSSLPPLLPLDTNGIHNDVYILLTPF
jgi:hypothetical protein